MKRFLGLIISIILFAGVSYAIPPAPNVLPTSDGTTHTLGTSSAGKNLTVTATEGSNIVTNGTFTTDLTGWAGANWAQSAGTALHTAGATTALTQAAATVTSGTTYKVVFNVTGRTAGSVTMSVGGVTGTARSTNATFTEYVTATATTALAFTPTTDFDGAIDNVTLQALTDATGDLTVQGNLVVRSPSTFNSSMTLNRGQILLPDGSESVPSLAFGNATGMGISQVSASIMQFSISGAVSGYFNNTSFLVNGNLAAFGGRLILDSGYTVNLYGIDATNTLSQRNTTNPQTYQLYETYVSGTEYSRGAFAMTSSGLILASQANTSTLRPAIGFQSEMNGQTLSLKTLTELLTINAAATTATSIQIPANVIVKAVSIRVTTVIPTAATFTVTGTTSGTVFNTAAISTAATTTNKGNLNCPYNNGAAQTITITPNVQPADNTGRVRITIHYEDITPPTA